MLEPLLRCFFIAYYFFYYLIQGKDEWKHKNGKSTPTPKPAIPTCCLEHPPPVPPKPETNNIIPSSPKPYQSSPKPYNFAGTSSWIERWFPRNGKVRRYGSKLWEYVKVVPLYLWAGIKWLFWTIVGFFAYIGRSFLSIFCGKPVEESDEFGEPKTYTYRRIEPPKDYREAERSQQEDEKEGVLEVEPTSEESEKKEKQSEQDLVPMSFYTRKQSLPRGERIESSPAPPAPPPPPGKPIRIPSSLDLATAANENEPINPEEKTVKLRAEGAIPVLPPGLMQEAKEAAERRARTVTPTSFVKIPQEVTQNVVTQLPPSNDEPDSTRYVFQTRKYSMPEYVRREVLPERSIPREPPKENQERSIPREVHLERNVQAIESVPRWQNVSPAPYLLGRPVFTPVDEVERIRDKFNRKTESRASSVAFSREPSIPAHMTSSYHADYNREKTASPIITFRDSSADRNTPSAIRPRFSASTPRPWNSQGNSDASHVKWALRRNNEDEPLSRIPLSSRSKSKFLDLLKVV
uniref:Uncharacterized protein n=1 Tax=Acrobeloides nanus TaxID=290746 RepID=A0A914DB03_9BILA